jgi:hypothetical protein
MKQSILKRAGLVLLLAMAQFLGAYAATRSEKQAVAADLPTNEQVQAKDAAITQCRVGRGFPVMGYGFKVICLKRDTVLWIR